MQCSFPNWFPKFEKCTIPSVILPIPDPVLDYLLEDGQLVLPAECNKDNRDCVESDYEDFGDVDWDSSEANSSQEGAVGSGQHELEQKTFPDFSQQVADTLSQLGGQAFCKLNWSSPKDATWIGFNSSLRCTSLSELYLLLKSSDFVTHDLTLPFKFCEDKDTVVSDASTTGLRTLVDYVLVLRRWVDVNPGSEFRCFVAGRQLVAVSQRDNTNYYDYIARQEASIKQDILTFFREHIEQKFPCDNYVFDVIRSRKDKVVLVDFNPFGETTDALFFTWPEIMELSSSCNGDVPNYRQQLDFRYATDSSGVQPHPYRHYSVPRDFVDLSTGGDPAKLIDFLKLKTTGCGSHADEDSDSDSDKEGEGNVT